jgi:hypothetical protein
VEKQREKQPGGVTGKGFVVGDPRINRTKPGPGRPPLWWRDQLARYEAQAIETIGRALQSSKPWVRLRAAQEVLDQLHGKPTQPLEVAPPVDVSRLTIEEKKQLDNLLARVLGDGARGNQVPAP